MRDSRILDWICLFASVKLYANKTFSKALFARGLLPPRKLGTFLPEEGFLASHLLAKLTKLNFFTDFIDKLKLRSDFLSEWGVLESVTLR